jgi:signal transduction histidine kinase
LVALYLARISFLQEKEQLRLWEAKLRAEKTAVEKSAFLANMSHEIRTPMNAVLGFSELLEGERLTPKQAQYVRSIRASGTALLELINNVLDLSKMEAGKLELRLEPTDLQETFAFLRTMFAQQAMVKSLNLKFEAQAVPHALLLDRLRLRQLLINLIGNAIKFTGRGEVSVRAQWEPNPGDRSRGSLLLEVKDTGLGISPAKQQEIFKPFVQSNISRNLEHQGTGLGLSIAQRIAQLMNGSITLESAEGVGSTFRVKLADVEISARLPASDLTEPAGAADFNDFAPALVLVVDDNLHDGGGRARSAATDRGKET